VWREIWAKPPTVKTSGDAGQIRLLLRSKGARLVTLARQEIPL